MYSDCITCSKIGISCNGPRFVAMTAPELLAWCRARKSHLGYSNAKLAELSAMPKGTIDRLFAGEHIDFRYETIRPLIKALAGGELTGNACPATREDDNTELLEQIERLKMDNTRLQDKADEIEQHYREELRFMRTQLEYEHSTRHNARVALIVVSVLLGIALLAIIAALIADKLNGNMGFFWLTELFYHGTGEGNFKLGA